MPFLSPIVKCMHLQRATKYDLLAQEVSIEVGNNRRGTQLISMRRIVLEINTLKSTMVFHISKLQHSLQSFFFHSLHIPSQFLYINGTRLESRLIFILFVNSRTYTHCSVWSNHYFVLSLFYYEKHCCI
jgi:hypothetical protein